MDNSNNSTLKKSIQALHFGKKLSRMTLIHAAVQIMQLLLNGHPKAMNVKKPTISRYAASLIGYHRGLLLSKPKSIITNFPKLDDFINSFVNKIFLKNGKIQNIEFFHQLFGTELIEDRVSLQNVKNNPSPSVLLQFAIQKNPISGFQKKTNLNKLKKMSINKIKLLLTPTGKFNPKLGSLNQARAQQHAITLTKKFAKTIDASKRMALATLIEQLQITENLNKNLLKNIRKHSS